MVSKKKDYPSYETLFKYVTIYDNGTYTYARLTPDENPYTLYSDQIKNMKYWSLILSEYNELYLVCHSDSSIRINLPDEIVDKRKDDAYVPYEFIHERAFQYMFNWLESFYGLPKEVSIVVKMLKEDYPSCHREANLNKVLG